MTLCSLVRIAAAVFALVGSQHAAEARCVGIQSALPSDDGAYCGRAAVSVPKGRGRTFDVGPQRPYETIGAVPWSTLMPGDTVNIHYRTTPYREKILISGRGTPEQWIRILGVPGPNGELPVISGADATTSTTMRWRWTDPKVLQWLGVIQVTVSSAGGHTSVGLPPGYIEIANLQVQDGFRANTFKAENGETLSYNGFAACIYVRSVQNIVIRNNVLTNCGQGIFTWTGDGTGPEWWRALQTNTVVSANYFYDNGNPGSYAEHQIYSESDGLIIEYNRFGPQKAGSQGSQIKDRSAGTVIRYNTIVQALSGWDIDLVEPEESWPSLSKRPSFNHTFVYGNVITSKGSASRNFIHWNEDHQKARGRAIDAASKLLVYHNTIVVGASISDRKPVTIFNGTWGRYECPPNDLLGTIDLRNNVIAVLPAASMLRAPPIRLAYCGKERIEFGVNWMSESTADGRGTSANPNDLAQRIGTPSFISIDDVRLPDESPARGLGGDLAPEVYLRGTFGDNSPSQRLVSPTQAGVRAIIGRKSDLGAF